MSSLQPLHALSLDSVQQQNFVKFYNSLTEKPPTTVRIFDRNEYYSVHGEDASTAARELFASVASVKRMGLEPARLDYLVLSRNNFETLVNKLLLVRRYRVEVYVAEGSVKSCEWYVKYRGSPGYLAQMEEVLELGGAGAGADVTPSSLMAVNIQADPVTKVRIVGVAWVSGAEYQLSVAEFTDDDLLTQLWTAEVRIVGVAWVSGAEYQLSVAEFTDDDLLTQLETAAVQLAPAECLVPQGDTEEYKAVTKVMERSGITVTRCKRSEFSHEGLVQDLNRLLRAPAGRAADADLLPETRCRVAVASLAAAVAYLQLMSDNTNFGRFRLSTVDCGSYLHMEPAALAALNVFPEPGDSSRAPSRSLYGLLDHCRSAHGKRLLAQWLRQPLRDINLINERLDVVECLVRDTGARRRLHDDFLRRLPDLQALARRLARRKAGLHDCYKIYQVVQRLPSLLRCLAETGDSTVHACLAQPISELSDDLDKYVQMIEATVDMDAIEKGDYLVKSSFDEQLQALGEQIEELQTSARAQLERAARDLALDAGKTIKLESSAAAGFHMRVTLKEEPALRGNSKYKVLDAVKGGVRFETSGLRALSGEYVAARERYDAEQQKVVAEIVGIAAGYSECLFCLSHVLSRLDVLVAFAVAAAAAPAPYCRPEVVESVDEFVLEQARHPCLELQEGVSFIPNDVVFKRGECTMHIVTGANMGGKSTWMRSAGVTALLAHAGSLVPCARARVPRLRTLAARVGASDREQLGQSTFMLEMIESAAILRTATPDSLVLIDELGRGTSTYEGCGLAWAIAEELVQRSQCFCLFATHYHELTRLPAAVAAAGAGGARNCHAAALVVGGQLVLPHRVEPGPAARSLGLHVARLAALPDSILQYAEAKQAELETNLFESCASGKSNEAEQGQEIVENFLRQCRDIAQETTSDDDLLEEIQKLIGGLGSLGNGYVNALMA